MSKLCGASNSCPFSPQQTTGGCACAELCPGYVTPGTEVKTSDHIDYTKPTTTTGIAAQENWQQLA